MSLRDMTVQVCKEEGIVNEKVQDMTDIPQECRELLKDDFQSAVNECIEFVKVSAKLKELINGFIISRENADVNKNTLTIRVKDSNSIIYENKIVLNVLNDKRDDYALENTICNTFKLKEFDNPIKLFNMIDRAVNNFNRVVKNFKFIKCRYTRSDDKDRYYLYIGCGFVEKSRMVSSKGIKIYL